MNITWKQILMLIAGKHKQVDAQLEDEAFAKWHKEHPKFDPSMCVPPNKR